MKNALRHLTILILWLFFVTTVQAKTLLVFGDSLSASYGIPIESSWVTLLKNRLKQQGYKYQVINESISGETTDGGLRRLPSILERTQPKIIILELGGNDGLRGFPLNVIKRNLAQLINFSLSANAKVLLLGVHIPPNYGPLYTQKFHENYLSLGQDQPIALVPHFLEGVATNKALMQDDGLHPNEKAQPILIDNVWEELAPLLEKHDE